MTQTQLAHPGMNDPAYRARRQSIADMSINWRPGDPIPNVDYTEAEHHVWSEVMAALQSAHQDHASREFRVGAESLALPTDQVPQLADVCRRLDLLSGFRIRPVPGLVPMRTFYGSLADLTFMSTQYVRHPVSPLYTPEPDVIHEIVGHINLIANPVFADLHYLAGRASLRCSTEESLEFFSRVFWFTLEFGVVEQDGDLRAYGAGLTSSIGEIQQFRNAEIRPFDISQMGALRYNISRYQPVLFSVPSIEWLHQELGAFFESFSTQVYQDRYAPSLTSSTS